MGELTKEVELLAIHEWAADEEHTGCMPSPRWIPTSKSALIDAEKRLFKNIRQPLRGRYVHVRQGKEKIWSVFLEKDERSPNSEGVPIVLLHGFAGGSGLWAPNLNELAADRHVYAIDLLGFGRSSRPKFAKHATLSEMEFVESIEDWRTAVGLEKMILLGHSFGGYLASSYALQYPSRVTHLILADPWGMSRIPNKKEIDQHLPAKYRFLIKILARWNALASLRAAGPFGPTLVRRFRPDLSEKFAADNAIYDYIYHCNAQQNPTGESAFKKMMHKFGWAKRPMIYRLPFLRSDVALSFIYGEDSWIDPSAACEIRDSLKDHCYATVELIKNAGHHPQADQAAEFNRRVNRICRLVEAEKDNYGKKS